MPVTVITGDTRGIGAAVAQRLAAAGHDLVLGYRRDAAAAEATVEIVRAHGVACTNVAADLTTDDGVEALFAAAGRLTGLVNNAGATFRYAPLAQTPSDEIRRTIETNLTAAVLDERRAASPRPQTRSPR